MPEKKVVLKKRSPALDEATLTRQIALTVLELQKSRERTKDLRDELKQLTKIFKDLGGAEERAG